MMDWMGTTALRVPLRAAVALNHMWLSPRQPARTASGTLLALIAPADRCVHPANPGSDELQSDSPWALRRYSVAFGQT